MNSDLQNYSEPLPALHWRRIKPVGQHYFELLAPYLLGVGCIIALIPSSFLLAAALYVVLFLLLASRRPAVALMIVFASAPFQTDLSVGGPFRFSIAELNLALIFPLCLLKCIDERRFPRVGPAFLPVLLYFAVCLASAVLHWRDSAVVSLLQMFIYLIVAVAVFGSFLRRPEQFHFILCSALIVYVVLAVIALLTSYNFLALNKNGWGGSFASGTVIAVELWTSERDRRRKMLFASGLVILTTALLFSLSRGAWLGAITGTTVIFALRGQMRKLLNLFLLSIPLVAILWLALPQESRDYAFGFGMDRVNIQARIVTIDVAKAYFDTSPLIGLGVGLRKDLDATNLVFITLAETGFCGLAAFLLLHVVCFHTLWQTRRKLVASQSEISVVVLAGALLTSRFMHGLVDHYWSRGPILQAWGTMGMATAIYYQYRARWPRSWAGLMNNSAELAGAPPGTDLSDDAGHCSP